MIKLIAAIYSGVLGAVGGWVLAAAGDVAEYAGGAALVGGAVAGVYGLLRRLADDHAVSASYGDLIDELQQENARLRLALRQCEERCRDHHQEKGS